MTEGQPGRAAGGVSIRVADIGDIATIADLRSAWRGDRSEAGFEDRLRSWFEEERSHRTIWLAFDGPRALGMASLVEYRRMPAPGQPDARWGYVGQVFVRAEDRRRGIGTQLMQALIAASETRRYVRLVLSPSDAALQFFRGLGFVRAGVGSTAPLLIRNRGRIRIGDDFDAPLPVDVADALGAGDAA